MSIFANMSLEEMLALNRELCEAIRAKRTAVSAAKVLTFATGDQVIVQGTKKHAAFKATVDKVLRVNVDVTSNEDGRRWRVAASMLTHA